MWRQAASLPRQVSIVGAKGFVKARVDPSRVDTTDMIRTVLTQALEESSIRTSDIDGFIAVPSLQEHHFMEAHYQATRLGLFQDRPHLRCKTIDTGGAGPVSALLEAVRLIKYDGLECVAVVAADAVGSMDADTFLSKADKIFLKLQRLHKNNNNNDSTNEGNSPAIPYGYDILTQYQMKRYGVTRDQLRLAVCLESLHAGLHPGSVYTQKHGRGGWTSLADVQQAPDVTPHISILECARRADGVACLLLASNRFLARQGLYREGLPTVVGGGESSGPLFPLQMMKGGGETTTTNNNNNSNGSVEENNSSSLESHFSCEEAMGFAYASAGNLTPNDIDFFGLYDCFPICLIRALEASGLCKKGGGGMYLQKQYQRMITAMEENQLDTLLEDKSWFPVNTHGGLLCYGAPWEVPAMFNIIEAVEQLEGRAQGRVIEDCQRALVYGNGGILSASAVAILSRSL